MYSCAQVSSIVKQEMSEAVLLYRAEYNSSTTTMLGDKFNDNTSTSAFSGSVIQPLGMEREELRVFHWVLLLVFLSVFVAGVLLILGIWKVNKQLQARTTVPLLWSKGLAVYSTVVCMYIKDVVL